jgi:hypothetical protein
LKKKRVIKFSQGTVGTVGARQPIKTWENACTSRSVQSHGQLMMSDDYFAFAHNYILEEKLCSLATFNPTEPSDKPTTATDNTHTAQAREF